METIKLYELAEKQGIKVDRFPLDKTGSLAIKLGSEFFIALDDRLCTEAEERVRLAHELGHCETAGFYDMHCDSFTRSKSELKANRWAIRALIPEEKYLEALSTGYTDIHSLAEFFNVTEDFMIKVAQFYCEKVCAHKRFEPA